MWSPSALMETMARLSAIRMNKDPLTVDLQPRNAQQQLSAGAKRQPEQTMKTAAKRRRGPCAFGCATTAPNGRGGEDWRRNPPNSPWPSIGDDEVLCKKCYTRALDLRKRVALGRISAPAATGVVTIRLIPEAAGTQAPEQTSSRLPTCTDASAGRLAKRRRPACLRWPRQVETFLVPKWNVLASAVAAGAAAATAMPYLLR